jgi:transposase
MNTMNVIAFDVGSEVSTACVITAKGEVGEPKEVPTRISVLKALIKKVPRPRQVVFEEGTQAAWLWSELQGSCDDVLVCEPRSHKPLLGVFKCDKNDTRKLGSHARANLLKRVWHGGRMLQSMRDAVRTYQSLTEESTRLKNQINAIFRGRGMEVGSKAYSARTRRRVVEQLPVSTLRDRAMSLGLVLDVVTEQRTKALKNMVKFARKHERYKAVRAIDGIGPVFSCMFLSEVGNPHRFRTRQQLWAYAGLAIKTAESSEFELRNDVPIRKVRAPRTRGLVHAYNRTLKYVFKQAAMILSRGAWKARYLRLLKHSKNESNAQLTLARKLACVMLHVAKTGEKYDITKVFKAQ